MTEISNVDQLKNYFKKLQRTINIDADFKFIDVYLVKKNKIDDILCCILAVLPDAYKKMMSSKEGQKLNSIICYNTLFKAIKRKFIFNSNVYMVDINSANKLISTIVTSIERDIKYAEKNA